MLLSSTAVASGPSPPPRALPEGAKMRIGRGRAVDFAFSPDGTRLAVACSIIGVWIHDADTGRELSLLTGHTDAVTSVAFSPDGTTLASGSYDRTVRLWDAQTFEHLATLTGHTGDTKALAFSPNGTTLASGAGRSSTIEEFKRGNEIEAPAEADSTVRLWSVADKKQKLALIGHTGWITALAFSPDGTTLASASTDGTARLSDAATGEPRATLNGHAHSVISVVFSPDSKRLASWGRDATVRLWDTRTGEQIASIENSSYGAIAFSPDGSTLVSSQGERNSTIRLWDTHTGKQKTTLDAQLGNVFSVVFSPDGSKIVTTEDWQNTTIRWWDLNSQQFHAARQDETPQVAGRALLPSARLAFSPDGETFVSQSYDDIRLSDAQTRKLRAKIEYPRLRAHRSGYPFVMFSADGETLACGDGTDKIWVFDADTGKYRATFNGHPTPVSAAALSPDGTTLASGKGQTLQLWDTHTGKPRATLNGHTAAVQAVAFSPDSTMLVSGSTDKTAILWDVRSGEALKLLVGHTNAVDNVVFARDGGTFASVSKKEIRVWDAFNGKQRFTLEGHPWSTASLAFSPDGKILATGGEWEIQLWDARTGQHKNTLSGHLDNNLSLTFSPDGKVLVSNGETVQLWDTSTSKNLSTLPYENGSVLTFSPDSKILAGNFGGTIELWDVHLRQRKARLDGHSSSVTSIAFSSKDGTFASASYDGTIVLWKPIETFDTNIVAKITPTSPVSPAIGDQLTFGIEITGAANVAGYQLTFQFDETALRYVSSANGDYLPGKAFFIKPIVKKNRVTLAATALIGMGKGDGTLAFVTFEVVADTFSPVSISHLILSDKTGKRSRPIVKNGEVAEK